MKNLLIRLAVLTPAPLKRWLYRHPRLLKPLARRLKNAMPADGFTVITIPAGPNKGLKLAVNRTTPNYYWVNDAYEPAPMSAMNNQVRTGMVVLDVGAHIGFDTMLLSRRVGDGGRVVSFEPDPANFRWLGENVRLNQLGNVVLINQAVSDRAGSLAFAADGLTTSHLINEALAAGHTAITVPTVMLDQWQTESGLKPAFIKIDVENHESAVLRGTERLMRDCGPALLIEIHSPASLFDCIALLKAQRYAIDLLPENEYYRDALNGKRGDDSTFTIAHILARPQDRPSGFEQS